MKKFIATLVTVFLVFSMIGCSNIDPDVLDAAKEMAEDYLSNQGNGEYITRDESEDILGKLASLKGYEIRFRYFAEDGQSEEAEGATIGQTRTAWWYVDDSGEGCAYYNKDGAYHVYDYSNGDWTYTSSFSGSAFDNTGKAMQQASTAYLYLANSYMGLAKKTGSAKVADRDCDIYTYDLSELGVGSKYELYVDKEYGITMKMVISASSGSTSASASYEVLSFTTGVKNPELPDPDSLNIVDYGSHEWPVNVFTEQIPAPSEGEITMTGLQGDTFYVMIGAVSDEYGAAYIKAVQDDKGFKGEFYDYSGYLAFSGKNSSGYEIQISYSNGDLTISMTK